MKLYAYLTIFVFIFSFYSVVLATDYTNSNFILRNPAITVSGGRSTTTNFEFYSATGQTAPGQSSNTSFTYQAGFLYFDVEEEETSASGGGGGGGGSGSVTFSGKAYPNSQVFLLKDSQIAQTTLADQDANFTVDTRVAPGDYIFSLYAKDYTGKSSRLISFYVKNVLGKDTAINNILIPPTISKDKREVKKGDTINIFGQSLGNAIIKINIETPTGSFSVNANSDNLGKYSYVLDTDLLALGEYRAESQVSFGGVTAISAFVKFTVGNENILEADTVCPQIADFNNDCAVNLIDFSILIYWFDKPNVPAELDLSPDGRADLVDFSIMAYYWTG